jgi:hypothetical protein
MTLINDKDKNKKGNKKGKKKKRRRRRDLSYRVTNRLKTCLQKRFLLI